MHKKKKKKGYILINLFLHCRYQKLAFSCVKVLTEERLRSLANLQSNGLQFGISKVLFHKISSIYKKIMLVHIINCDHEYKNSAILTLKD